MDLNEEVPQSLEALVKPHVDSFDWFVDKGIQLVVDNLEPLEVVQEATNTHVSVWLEDVVVGRPVREIGRETVETRMFPRECREAGSSYTAPLVGLVCVQIGDGEVEKVEKRLGKIPVMVRSARCNLRMLTRAGLVQKGEEASEFGGYFVINGIEKIIRLLVLPKRNYCIALKRSANAKRGPSYSDKAVAMRCVRPDMTSMTIRVHYLNDGRATVAFTLRKREYFIPVALLLRALVETTDREMYDMIVGASVGPGVSKSGEASTWEVFAAERAELMLAETARRGLLTRQQCLAYLGAHFRDVVEAPRYKTDVAVAEKLIQEHVLIHLTKPLDKYNCLIFMVRKLYALALGSCTEDNPDSLMHHDLMLPGHLMTMAFKERCQDLLAKFKQTVQINMRMAPDTTDLSDRAYVWKTLDSAVASDPFQKLAYMISTGNLVSQSGLDLSQVSGFSVVADKLNFLRYVSHFRSVHRGAFFTTLRTTTVRKLLPESWGFLCPVHTPDGSPCGLLNHLARACSTVTEQPDDPAPRNATILRELVSSGMVVPTAGSAFPNAPAYLPVLLDGQLVGFVGQQRIPRLVHRLRFCKVDPSSLVPDHLEVGVLPPYNRTAYPGVFLFTTVARMVRPVIQRAPLPGKMELVGPFEQVYMKIRCVDGDVGGSEGMSYTHEETDSCAMLSFLATLTPWSDYNQSPRNMYQCQMAKQTMGTPALALPHRLDNKLYRIQTPQSPIARTRIYKEYENDEYPAGTNAVVAVLSYTGYDMEDAMMINKSSMERGFGHASVYKVECIDLTKEKGGRWLFGRGNKGYKGAASRWKGGKGDEDGYEHEDRIDEDGLPRTGARIRAGEAWCSVMDTVTGSVKLHKLKGTDEAFIDSVTLVGNTKPSQLQIIKVKLRYNRNPIIGDKFSSRHGQKGTLSLLYRDIDMPYCANTGIRPDVIINPHAFPSRMTIGMLVESLASKGAAAEGHFVDATPFKHAGKESGAGDDHVATLVKNGFSRYGSEVLISGITGTEMPCEIFVGCVYYQRLRHMVSDKFQVRSIGPINKLTHQPIKGRKLGGGIRFGEMERDSLLAHGAAFLLHDRLHSCSDRHIADVCRLCGSLLSPTLLPAPLGVGTATAADKRVVCRTCDTAKGVEKVALPYVFKYLAAELAAMNIRVMLTLSE